MKIFEVFTYINQFESLSEESLKGRLNSGWQIENSCYAGGYTVIYILSKEE